MRRSIYLIGILFYIESGFSWSATASTEIVIGRAPVVSEGAISSQDINNDFVVDVGDVLVVDKASPFLFSDADGDIEHNTIYEWRDGNGAIAGIGESYTVQSEDYGRTFRLYVTPLTDSNVTEPYVGDSVPSINIIEVQNTVDETGFIDVIVNGQRFDVDAGFPSTGFVGAEFTLSTFGEASDYEWSSNESWASVDSSGTVKFTDMGNSYPVTITATPKIVGKPITYTFSVRTWFFHNGYTLMNWGDARLWCINQGLNQASRSDLTRGLNVRRVGSLWSEWGPMEAYGGGNFTEYYVYWTSEAKSSSYYYGVRLSDGEVTSGIGDTLSAVICQRGL